MSAIIENKTPIQTVVYEPSHFDIMAWSIFLTYFDPIKINDIIEQGMSNLYANVIPKPEDAPNHNEPVHTSLSSNSYTYTSYFKHNRLDIHVFHQSEYRCFVQFRITPTHYPNKFTQPECDQIDTEIADVIYTKIQDHGDQLEEEFTEQIYDEHSYCGR
jgi:hypothetical protein